MTDFQPFPKMARYSREVIVTEKIDGTNASIFIGEDGEFLTGSRTRWVIPGDDNFGFSKWAHENKDELMQLGPGTHFGEWWGQGIQRKYDMEERRFSLFNVSRWSEERQLCCYVVPTLWRGNFDDFNASDIINQLASHGSYAATGFMDPEGIVIYHLAAGIGFKRLIHKDGEPKGAQKA